MSGKDEKIKLSIVMPNYNHFDLAKEMIDSILANDFQDWELLVVDDGSDLKTLTAMRQYETDNRITVYERGTRMPKGAQTCRNMGLKLAKGEFVIFFDNDDYILPHCLGRRVEMLQARPDLDFMVFPSSVLVNNKIHEDYSINIYGYKIHNDDIAAFARRELPFVVWNNIYRRESLLKYKLIWDVNLSSLQDADFNLSALLAGLRYDYALVSPAFCYRLAGSSSAITSRMWDETHFRNHEYALRKFYLTLQSKFGHKYDKDLYRGVQFILVSVLERVVDKRFAKIALSILQDFDRKHLMALRVQLTITQLLAHYLPVTTACKIGMLPYKIYLRKRLKSNRIVINKLRNRNN